MAGLNWVWARGATHNSATINGVVAFGDEVSLPVITSSTTDSGLRQLVGAYPTVRVSLQVRDYATMQQLVAAGKANFVGKYYDEASALKKRTYKNVGWHSQSRVMVMEPGASGPTPVWQIDGVLDGGTDSLATQIVDASDS